jgi:hypothetical protein
MRIVDMLAVLCLFAVQLALPGCASTSTYQAAPAPVVPEVMPHSLTDGSVEVRADPYVQPDRQRKYFDAELTRLGLLPIQVFVRNGSEPPLVLSYDAVWLELQDGTQIQRLAPINFDDLRDRRTKEGQQEKERRAPECPPSTGSNSDPRQILLEVPYVNIAVAPFVFAVLLMETAACAEEETRVRTWLARREDYSIKELDGIALDKDESRSGFVYFGIPPDVAPSRI